jgi:hypothetical protein
METNLIGKFCTVQFNQHDTAPMEIMEIVAVGFSSPGAVADARRDGAFFFLLKRVSDGHIESVIVGPTWQTNLVICVDSFP